MELIEGDGPNRPPETGTSRTLRRLALTHGDAIPGEVRVAMLLAADELDMLTTRWTDDNSVTLVSTVPNHPSARTGGRNHVKLPRMRMLDGDMVVDDETFVVLDGHDVLDALAGIPDTFAALWRLVTGYGDPDNPDTYPWLLERLNRLDAEMIQMAAWLHELRNDPEEH